MQRVADSRKRKYDDVEPLAQGRVWTGAQAKQNGLVDELGGIDRAIELVKQKAKIAPSEKIVLVAYPPRRSLFQMLLDRDTDLTLLESLVSLSARESWFESTFESTVDARIAARVKQLVGDLPLGALSQGGILRLMPYRIVIR